MSDLYKEYLDQPGDNVLTQIAELAREQLEAEAKVLRLTQELADATLSLRQISEKRFPDLLEKCQQEKLTVAGGITVELKTNYQCGISEENAPLAHEWMEEKGHGSLIKRQITIEFGKGEEAWAKKFLSDLRRRKKALNLKDKKSVHAQTLKSLVNRLMSAGEDIPKDLFGVFPVKKTHVSLKKGGKKGDVF